MPDTEDSGSGDWIPDAEVHRMDTEQKKMIVMRGEDIPFADEDIPYSEDDSSETLMEDIVHAGFMLKSGFSGEAEEDLHYILEKLKNGGYNVDKETIRSQTAVIEDMLKGIGTY
jgi:hypothetical protein